MKKQSFKQVLAGLWLILAIASHARATDPYIYRRIVLTNPEVSAPVTPFLFKGDVRKLPPLHVWKPGDPLREIPRRSTAVSTGPVEPRGFGLDPLLKKQNRFPVPMSPAPSISVPSRDFDGASRDVYSPADTVGDVGPNHYIQMANGTQTQVLIYDKATPTPNLLASFGLDSLWVGAGNCGSGGGDPIVVYDRQADRWLLSEFALHGNHLCVYISQTADPVSGGWYAYDFTVTKFPDYPKYAVWPTDANGGQGSYIVTTNEGAPVIYALNRGSMLTGSASSFQRFATIPSLSGFGFQGVLAPADTDGPNPPPATAPAPAMLHRDTETNGPAGFPGQDFLEVWEFNVNWTTPASSTLTKTADVSTAEFDSDLAFIPQPGSATTLDPLREPVMNRLQYMNHGAFQTLVGDFVTDVTGTDLAGMRWFELRGGPSAWSLFQEGTVSPDATNRWMGAIGMDQSGDIGLGYSVSSTSVYPGIRYTGRLSADAAGTMPASEQVGIDGTAANSNSRWGDYAALSLDPSDDCTLWFTSMYNKTSAWSTRILSFKFGVCGNTGPYVYRESDSATDSCSAGGAGDGNAILDPGEKVTLQMTAKNYGSSSATNIVGQLTTSTSGVTVVNDTASFPDLSANSSGASIAPYFSVGVGTAVTCGTNLDFTVNFTSNEGTWSTAFTKMVGVTTPFTVTYNSTAPSQAVPNPGTITSAITVADTGTVTDVNVTIGSLAHTSDRDLDIFLIAPNGTRIELSTDNGNTGDNYTNTVFDDEAGSAIAGGSAAFTGSFTPEGSLASADGISSNGTWTLEVTDDNGDGNSGTLNSWSITISRTTPVCNACAVSAPTGDPAITWSGTTALQWGATTNTNWYNVYRGDPADLPNLLNASNDSCRKWTGDSLNTGTLPTNTPAAGTFWWYIVRAANTAGEGPAGNATSGARILNSTGTCP